MSDKRKPLRWNRRIQGIVQDPFRYDVLVLTDVKVFDGETLIDQLGRIELERAKWAGVAEWPWDDIVGRKVTLIQQVDVD